MYLENIVRDARDPARLGRFWMAALGATLLRDDPDGLEARVEPGGAGYLDLGFQRVVGPSWSPSRLHLDLTGGEQRAAHLIDLGATVVDPPWTTLADPEGEPFGVVEADQGAGPIAALRLASADPARDAALWAAITGWGPAAGASGVVSLRHPSGAGPVLDLYTETGPKQGKNRTHLDVRAERRDGDPTDRPLALGARRLVDPPALPWTVWADTSGNEFCVLDAR